MSQFVEINGDECKELEKMKSFEIYNSKSDNSSRFDNIFSGKNQLLQRK